MGVEGERRQSSGDAWGDDISQERKAELEHRLQEWEQEANHGERKGPFDGVALTGADVFWLAARALAGLHEEQTIVTALREPSLQDWAILWRQPEVSLGRLHLERAVLTAAQLEVAVLAGAHLEGTDLRTAHLERAILREAHLAGADLRRAHLEGAILLAAHAERATLDSAHLEGANLRQAHLEAATLGGAYLERADLHDVHLEGANLDAAHVERADCYRAHLEGAFLGGARLERGVLNEAHLEGAVLAAAHLERALLSGAHLEGANLSGAHLEGADFRLAHLEGRVYGPDDKDEYRRVRQWSDDFPAALPPADLAGASLDSATSLAKVTLGRPGRGPGAGYVSVADVRWGGVNLAVVDDWPAGMRLGDERKAWAWQPPVWQEVAEAARPTGNAIKTASRKERAAARRQHAAMRRERAANLAHIRLDLVRAAVRANRQLAMALREQGMNEEADRFAYRAQVCQRRALRLQHHYLRAVGSWLLDVVAGYGYKPLRSIMAYVFIVCLFAGAYLLNAQFAAPHLTWDEALVLSISSFHGRGFFNSGISLGDTLARLAAGEAIIGLLIEITFIATFTQRFFAR